MPICHCTLLISICVVFSQAQNELAMVVCIKKYCVLLPSVVQKVTPQHNKKSEGCELALLCIVYEQ